MESIIAQLKADLAEENQEINRVIEGQEYFMDYLKKLTIERENERDTIKEIIKEFEKICI